MKVKHLTYGFLLSACTLSAQTKKDSISPEKEIQAVIIKAYRKKQHADKASYTFDQEALKAARYAKDLVASIPQFHIDPVSNTISNINGGKVLLLINGIEATNMQLQSITPEAVVRIDYYDVPPARWANKADFVVNVITRNPENGYVGGFNVMDSPLTGFVNGSAYFTYTKGRHNFGIDYNINLRDYDNQNYHKSYEYMLNSTKYRSDENQKTHFGYTNQDINLKYFNSKENSYTFQAEFALSLLNSFSNANGNSVFTQGLVSSENSTIDNNKKNYINPSLDLYFAKNLGKKDELMFNIIGSHFNTNNWELAREWVTATGTSVFSNTMELKVIQNNIVAEAAHNHTFSIGKLSSGYRLNNQSISNNLNNLLGHSDYKVNYLKQYFYTEFSGKKNKLLYRIGAGLTHIYNKSELEKTNQWSFTPNLLIGYQLAQNQSIRLISSYRPYSPSSSELSSNIIQVAPNIIKRGNPFLKPEYSWKNQVRYSLNNKYFDITIVPFYNITYNGLNQYFVFDAAANRYALTHENTKRFEQTGFLFSGVIKPLGTNKLKITANITPTWGSMHTNRGAVIKNNYISNNFNIQFQHKQFALQYQFNIPVYTLDGAFLSTNENSNHLFLQYKHKQWTFTSGVFWLGMPSEYKTKSLRESLVNYKVETQIHNNRNMLVFGVSYDFSKGNNGEIDKKLDNHGGDASTF